jgi:hypothetical protein
MYLDYNGNLTIAGNLKSLATQVGGAGATLAVNSRTCFYSTLNETLTLPATCAVGDTVTVVGAGTLSGLFTITKATGQSIYMGSGTAYSSIAEQASGDAVQLTCTVANTSWTASSLVGTFTETP